MHGQGVSALKWVVKRGKDVEDLKLELDCKEIEATEYIALHASSLQNLQKLHVLSRGLGSGEYNMATACALSSALMLLLTGSRGLRELTLQVRVSLYMPPMSSVRHLTLHIFQDDSIGTIVGALSERACASLANLRGLETLTLFSADSGPFPQVFLKLRGLHLQSLRLDGVPLRCVDVTVPCKVHLLPQGNYECDVSTAMPAVHAAVQTLQARVMADIGSRAVVNMLTTLNQLTHLDLYVHTCVLSCSMLDLGSAAPQLEILHLTGMKLSLTLGAASKLRVLSLVAYGDLVLECDSPETIADNLTYVHISYNRLQGLGLLQLMSSMQDTGKRVLPCPERSRRTHTVARHPQHCYKYMLQLLCVCRVCLQCDIDNRMKACSVKCGHAYWG